jgi:hypothetical protein
MSSRNNPKEFTDDEMKDMRASAIIELRRRNIEPEHSIIYPTVEKMKEKIRALPMSCYIAAREVVADMLGDYSDPEID